MGIKLQHKQQENPFYCEQPGTLSYSQRTASLLLNSAGGCGYLEQTTWHTQGLGVIVPGHWENRAMEGTQELPWEVP